MRANYYDSKTNKDHIYYERLIIDPKVIKKGNYILTLNNESFLSQSGMQNTYYSEVRWWNYYRSIDDIKMYRY